MAEKNECSEDQVAQFKQEVFSKLAFLGMPHEEVAAKRHLWKIVNLCAKLGTDATGASATKPELQKLVKALARELGAPRADLFVKWLVDRIHTYFARKITLPIPEAIAAKVPEAAAAVASLKGEGRASISISIDSETPVAVPTNEMIGHGRPSPAIDDLSDEAWVEVKATGGKVYYWDRRTGARLWELPAGVKAKWTSHKSSDGRTYYSDRSGNSCWMMPPLATATGSAGKAESGAKAKQKELKPLPTEHLFLPEVGLLKPVALPNKSTASAGNDDLGPFEAALEILEPETPVLPAAATRARQSALEPETPACQMLPPSAQSGPTVTLKGEPNIAANESNVRTKAETPIVSNESTALQEELLALKKQLAELKEKQLASASVMQQSTPSSEQEETKMSSTQLHQQDKALEGCASEKENVQEQEDPMPEANVANADEIDSKPDTAARHTPQDKEEKKSKPKATKREMSPRRSEKPSRKSKRFESSADIENASSPPAKPRETSGDTPLRRRRPLAPKPEPQPTADQEEKGWDLWSQRPESKPEGKQKGARRKPVPDEPDEQQKRTDEYLAQFGAELSVTPTREGNSDLNKKRAAPRKSSEARKKPRNAFAMCDFWSQKRPEKDSDAKSAAPAASDSNVSDTESLGVGRRSRPRSPCQATENKDDRRSRSRSPAPEADNKDIKKLLEKKQNMLEKFLTVVRYGAPPGRWESLKSPTSEKGVEDKTVFEFRQSRRTSMGGA